VVEVIATVKEVDVETVKSAAGTSIEAVVPKAAAPAAKDVAVQAYAAVPATVNPSRLYPSAKSTDTVTVSSVHYIPFSATITAIVGP